jgi:hypothetical protein
MLMILLSLLCSAIEIKLITGPSALLLANFINLKFLVSICMLGMTSSLDLSRYHIKNSLNVIILSLLQLLKVVTVAILKQESMLFSLHNGSKNRLQSTCAIFIK